MMKYEKATVELVQFKNGAFLSTSGTSGGSSSSEEGDWSEA